MGEIDMRGRVCALTGANTGIGRAVARELARREAHVLMLCRSEERTRPVLEAIRRETGNDRIELLLLDLGSLDSVRRCAEALLRRDQPLHVLVNNAGLATRRGMTKDGFELSFGVNHLGHFLLTLELLPRLLASAPARVVHLASNAHYRARGIDFEALRRPPRSLTGMREYSVSKLANVLFNAELARRLPDTRVTSYAVHPGVVASDIWRNVPWPVRPLMKQGMITNEEGARAPLYCITAEELAGESGHYYADRQRKEPSKHAQDPALARELWERSVEWTGAPPLR